MNRLKKFTLFFTVMLLCIMWVGCSEAEKTPAGEDPGQKVNPDAEFKAIAKAYMQIRNETDRAKSAGLIEKIIAPDFVMHDYPYVDLIERTEFLKYIDCALIAFVDYRFNLDEVIVKDDKIVCSWTVKGKNTGPYNGHVASGKDVNISGVSIFRIANGQIAEEWQYYNRLAILDQLGYEVNTTLPASEVACK